MYNIVKGVISNRKFELKDILRKIDVLWTQSSITNEQRDELISLAQSNASAKDSVDMLDKVSELERRIVAIETQLSNNSIEDDTEGDSTEEPTEE